MLTYHCETLSGLDLVFATINQSVNVTIPGQQASLFESVPSVEYKRLEDERSGLDQNDSLEDITVSLNDPKSAKQIQIVQDKDQQEPLNNNNNNNNESKGSLSYIDEDDPGAVDNDNTNEPVCDDCVNAGHVKIVEKQGQDVEESCEVDNRTDASNNAADAEIGETAKTDNDTSGDQVEAVHIDKPKINIEPDCVTMLEVEGNNKEKKRKDSGLSISSSKLSVTSFASGGDSSISFSADSLGGTMLFLDCVRVTGLINSVRSFLQMWSQQRLV